MRIAELPPICLQEGSRMTRIIRRAVVVVLLPVGAGVAVAATSPVIMGPSVGISSPVSPLSQVPPSTGTTTTISGGVTTTTVGDTTTVIGSSNPINPGGTTSPTTPGTTPTTPTATEQLVAVTRTVEPGAPVSVFV